MTVRLAPCDASAAAPAACLLALSLSHADTEAKKRDHDSRRRLALFDKLKRDADSPSSRPHQVSARAIPVPSRTRRAVCCAARPAGSAEARRPPPRTTAPAGLRRLLQQRQGLQQPTEQSGQRPGHGGRRRVRVVAAKFWTRRGQTAPTLRLGGSGVPVRRSCVDPLRGHSEAMHSARRKVASCHDSRQRR